MPKTKRLCEWFVRPLNPQTNEMIAVRLAELQMVDESKTVLLPVRMSPASVKKYSVWKVPHALITELCKGHASFSFLKFSVYNRREGESCARIWKFTGKKKSAKVTKAKKDLETLKKKKDLL